MENIKCDNKNCRPGKAFNVRRGFVSFSAFLGILTIILYSFIPGITGIVVGIAFGSFALFMFLTGVTASPTKWRCGDCHRVIQE